MAGAAATKNITHAGFWRLADDKNWLYRKVDLNFMKWSGFLKSKAMVSYFVTKERNYKEKTFFPWCQYPGAHRDHTVGHWFLQGIFWGLFKFSQQHPGDLLNCKGPLFLQVPNLQSRLIHSVTYSHNACAHHTWQWKQQSIPCRWSPATLSTVSHLAPHQ